MFVFLQFFRVTIIVLLHSNQQVSQTLQHAPQITELIMEDLDDFVQKTKEQAVAVANGATEHTINGINQDLEGRSSEGLNKNVISIEPLCLLFLLLTP